MANKVVKRFNNWQLSLFIFSTFFFVSAYSQQPVESKLSVTSKIKNYKKQVAEDSAKRMIELKTLIPSIVYDLRYATTNNFMHRMMYSKNTNQTFLRMPAALALKQEQNELNEKGLGLKIFDAYRPYSVTVKFWEPGA